MSEVPLYPCLHREAKVKMMFQYARRDDIALMSRKKTLGLSALGGMKRTVVCDIRRHPPLVNRGTSLVRNCAPPSTFAGP